MDEGFIFCLTTQRQTIGGPTFAHGIGHSEKQKKICEEGGIINDSSYQKNKNKVLHSGVALLVFSY